jgi:hypothetical protein
MWSYGIFFGHFGNAAKIWHIFHRLGILSKEKSGNPGDGLLSKTCRKQIERLTKSFKTVNYFFLTTTKKAVAAFLPTSNRVFCSKPFSRLVNKNVE